MPQPQEDRSGTPYLHLSAHALQDILDQWLEEHGLAMGEELQYNWIFDHRERPIGVNIHYYGQGPEPQSVDD